MKPGRNTVLALIVGASALLSACSLGGNAVPLSVIEPQLEPVDVAGLVAVDWSIEVPRPITDQMRASDRLVVRRGSSRLQVYSGVVWLDSMPDMVQTLMVQSLSDSEKFKGVGRSGLRARFALLTEVRRFELVDDVDGLRVEFVVSASVIHQQSGESAGGRTFRANVPVNGSGLVPTISAFEMALSDVLENLTRWTIETGGAFDDMQVN